MKPPFIIYGLPRSRTFWLSRFLSYGDWDCGHDEIRHARSLGDVATWFNRPNTGTVETAAAPFWRIVPKHVRVVVVRRSVAGVVGSFSRLGFKVDPRLISRLDAKLDQIEARVPGVLSVSYGDLADETVCARIFERCLPYRHDHAWWAAFDALNLQTNFANTLRYYDAYRPQLEKLAGAARYRMLSDLNPPERPIDGVTIQEEPYEKVWADAAPLMQEHCVSVGEEPDSYLSKNNTLCLKMASADAWLVATARSNGRVLGYASAIIGPSLESQNITTAMQLVLFVSADAGRMNIGPQLQRAMLAGARCRGVSEYYFRAGVRGQGPRLGKLYTRLGATSFGEMYKLELRQ